MGIGVTLLVAVIGSSGVSSLIVACLQHRWAAKEKTDKRVDALVAAQKVLMIDRVRYLGRVYINTGEISLADKENLRGMYAAYKGLGGNGDLETVMDEVENLPVKG